MTPPSSVRCRVREFPESNTSGSGYSLTENGKKAIKKQDV